VVLLRRVAAWEWLRVVVPVGLLAAAALLVVVALLRASPATRLVPVGVAVGLVVAIAAPTAWSASALQGPASGTFPDARPVAASMSLPGFGPPGSPGGANPPGPPGGGFPGFGTLSNEELDWLDSQRGTERWLVAVASAMQAAPTIIEGRPVMAMGGFFGSDPAMTQERLADLVDRGELRFLAAGGGMPFGANISGPAVAAQVCTAVPASTWGGTGAGVLDCKGRGEAIRTGKAPASPAAGGGFAALENCLKDKGVTVKPGGPPDFSDPKLAEAFRTCIGTSLPGGAPPGGPPGLPPVGAPPGR
jgi:hypothetical protein